jgi:hypothetical protein
MAKPLSRSQRQLQDDLSIYIANVIKFASFMVLRDMGWGKKRLNRFSARLDEILKDVNAGRLNFSDMLTTIEEETGMRGKHFLLEYVKEEQIQPKKEVI